MPEKQNHIESKIKVLHATLFLQMGGLESVIMDLCRQHNDQEFVVEVLCFNMCDPSYRSELEKNGVTVHVIKRKGRFDIVFFRKIIALLKKRQIDVLHAHSGCVFNSFLCAWLAGTPVKLFTEHGLPFFADGTPMPVTLKTKIEDQFIGKIASQLVAVSSEITDSLKARYAGAYKKICSITNGIDTDLYSSEIDTEQRAAIMEKFAVPSNRFIIGSVGRLAPVKNYSSLLQALQLLKKRQNIFHLILVGDGPEADHLKALARKLNIEENVTFTGVQYGLHKILPVFDVFVLPSWTEGTSISLLEALSCGIPVVVSDAGGNPNVVEDGASGFLFPVNTPQKIAELIDLLFDDKNMLKQMKVRARTRIIGRYDVKTMVWQYEDLYRKLLTV